jgi:uncharacterized protein YeaO (DUF488 family)
MTPRKHALRIKRVYEPAEDGDGQRVLVDGIWPRGMTRQAAALDLWLKDIAPSAALRKWFGHEPARWPEFQRRYRTELAENEAAVARLRTLLKAGPVTLLYGARDVEHNQAVVLLDYIRKSAGPR